MRTLVSRGGVTWGRAETDFSYSRSQALRRSASTFGRETGAAPVLQSALRSVAGPADLCPDCSQRERPSAGGRDPVQERSKTATEGRTPLRQRPGSSCYSGCCDPGFSLDVRDLAWIVTRSTRTRRRPRLHYARLLRTTLRRHTDRLRPPPRDPNAHYLPPRELLFGRRCSANDRSRIGDFGGPARCTVWGVHPPHGHFVSAFYGPTWVY